jgi:tetratricopeptide (TPR) repeat protein
LTEALTHEIEELRRLMGSPRDPHGRVFAQLGDALRRSGAHREALSLLLDGVAEHPNFSPGHLVLAWTAQESGDLDVARAAYERTVQLDPENPNGIFGLGAILDRAGDPRGEAMMEEAESLDRRVRVLAPRLPLDSGNGRAAEASPLQDLPFLSLRDLAPDAGDPALAALPFVSLADLAPDVPEDALGDPELAALPFVPLHALAPDADPGEPEQADGARAGKDLETLPFVPVDELAPDDDEELETPSSGAMEERAPFDDEDLETLPFVAVDETVPGDDVELETLPFVAVDDLAPGDREARGVDEALEGDPDEDEDEDEPLGGPLMTRTMGELLVRQGLMVEAVEVFVQLVEDEPEDEALRARLQELRAALGDEPVEPALLDARDAESREADAEAAHPSLDPPRHHPPIPSPFHLVEEEGDEDAGEGPPVGDYFARLLAWSPRRAPEDDGGGSSAS